MATVPALEAHGRRALARLGARLSLIYLLGASSGVAATVGARTPPWWSGLPLAAVVLGPSVLVWFGLNCTVAPGPGTARLSRCDRIALHVLGAPMLAARPWAWPALLRLMVVVAGSAVLARIVTAGDRLGWSEAHALVGWVVPGVCLGLALAAGPWWGLAAFVVLSFGLIALTPGEAAAAVPATLAGAAVSVVVAAFINVAARRGFARTEDDIRSAEAAQAARADAEAQLLARRRLDRLLHDTVLSTLTLLAHGGRGVRPGQVRADCRRDLAALRSERWGVSPHMLGPAGRERIRAADQAGQLAGCLRRQATPIAERLEAVRELAARSGVDLRVHVQAAGLGEPSGAVLTAQGAPDLAVVTGPLPDAAVTALEAWQCALAECVTNITRHAGVSAADVVLGRTDTALVTLVVDEGAGFETSAVSPERLGLSGSVHDRLHDVGGRARVWSRPGQGTVVELVLPWPRGSGDVAS